MGEELRGYCHVRKGHGRGVQTKGSACDRSNKVAKYKVIAILGEI